MSEIPGYTLEDYLEWCFNYTTDEMIDFFEPHRETIEYWLSDFDEETQSWRDYAPYCPIDVDEMWPPVHRDIEDEIDDVEDSP